MPRRSKDQSERAITRRTARCRWWRGRRWSSRGSRRRHRWRARRRRGRRSSRRHGRGWCRSWFRSSRRRRHIYPSGRRSWGRLRGWTRRSSRCRVRRGLRCRRSWGSARGRWRRPLRVSLRCRRGLGSRRCRCLAATARTAGAAASGWLVTCGWRGCGVGRGHGPLRGSACEGYRRPGQRGVDIDLGGVRLVIRSLLDLEAFALEQVTEEFPVVFQDVPFGSHPDLYFLECRRTHAASFSMMIS